MLRAIIILILLIVAAFSKPIGSIVNLLWRIFGIVLILVAVANLWQAIAQRKKNTTWDTVKHIIKNIFVLAIGIAIAMVRLV